MPKSILPPSPKKAANPAVAPRPEGSPLVQKSRPRLRDLGIGIGRYPVGPFNAITDVPGVRVGLVHGRMKPAEKQAAMAAFKAGDIQLVFTTVDETRTAIADSRSIRTAALANRVTYYTTMAGCEAVVKALKHHDDLVVYSLQELHAKLH